MVAQEYIQNKQQLTGLLIGTGLAASIQLALVPPLISFYEYVITLYFLAGFIFGYLSPKLSWRWGGWFSILSLFCLPAPAPLQEPQNFLMSALLISWDW